MPSPSPLLPEFFAFLGIEVFLMLSLLSCLLDDRLPNALPYVYQMAALAGFGHLIISREFFSIFGDYMRFWYCFIYLLVALSNIVAVNIYFAAVKGLWSLAKVWSGAVTFPTIVISTVFVFNYGFVRGATLLQITLVVFAIATGLSIAYSVARAVDRTRKLGKKEARTKIEGDTA